MNDEVSVWDNEGGFNREKVEDDHGSRELEKLIKIFEKMTPEEYAALYQKACEDPSPRIII